jgi:N-formylglutamate amidohydrolase
MDPDQARPTDSLRTHGGTIPDSEGSAAFSLTLPEPSALPLLIAVPHAGRAYPGSLLERMRNPGFAALKLEDRYVDRLAVEVARQTGAALLVAHAPRAMIDLNRDTRDVDWDMFARGRPDTVGSYTPGMRARSGLGLIPRRIPGLGELWKRRHETEELSDRIATIHAPYHECLGATLMQLRERWGIRCRRWAIVADRRRRNLCWATGSVLPATEHWSAAALDTSPRCGAGPRTTGPMPAAMCWNAMLLRVRAFTPCSWKSTGRAISIRGWPNRGPALRK